MVKVSQRNYASNMVENIFLMCLVIYQCRSKMSSSVGHLHGLISSQFAFFIIGSPSSCPCLLQHRVIRSAVLKIVQRYFINQMQHHYVVFIIRTSSFTSLEICHVNIKLSEVGHVIMQCYHQDHWRQDISSCVCLIVLHQVQ